MKTYTKIWQMSRGKRVEINFVFNRWIIGIEWIWSIGWRHIYFNLGPLELEFRWYAKCKTD